MMVNEEVTMEITPAGRRKLNPKIYEAAIKIALTQTTLKAEAECIKESPKGPTGNLQRGHSHNIEDDEGQVINSEPYALWIIWGDGSSHPAGNIYYYEGKPYVSKGVPNNYPQRVLSRLAAQKYASKQLHKALKQQGVI